MDDKCLSPTWIFLQWNADCQKYLTRERKNKEMKEICGSACVFFPCPCFHYTERSKHSKKTVAIEFGTK
uniref:Uncharacterized protein n=1 Tax=Anguilla anguilla TaxID=7936 RepID=A0A0E9UYJ2_ANGAN